MIRYSGIWLNNALRIKKENNDDKNNNNDKKQTKAWTRNGATLYSSSCS